MIEQRGDWWWPAHDHHCHPVIFLELKNLDYVLKRCKKFDVAVQAGGNVGVFPKHLATKFGFVITFEPEYENFACLQRNVTETNVQRIHGALGYNRKAVGIVYAHENAGAHYVNGDGNIEVWRIDDLGLTDCDLIYLDIEGSEYQALRGAEKTIRRCKPVVTFEEKGLGAQYGITSAQAQNLLTQFGYRVVEKVGNDVVCVPMTDAL